ncbi:hypothetical protein M0804_007206 [Polistes exclamans]|nr:hypothetical protein M0804_007206 [Polistes exclamans]
MSSASDDETEVTLAEPVQRIRSGRARKTPVVAKKPPVKKLLARATRSSKKIPEIEEIEEESHVLQVVDNLSENGVQRLNDIIIERHNDSTQMLHLELEDSGDTNIHEVTIDQTIQSEVTVPELETPPPPNVNNIPNTPILSSFKVKEATHLMKEHSGAECNTIIIEESSMDKEDMLCETTQIEMEGQSLSNDGMINQRVLIDFEEVVTEDGETITQVTKILDTDGVQSENVISHVDTGIEVMEVDDSQQEISEVVENIMDKVEPDTDAMETENIELSNLEISEMSESSFQIDNGIKKIEPDTEAVSEDELPNEASAKEPETEAVSDEELPAAAPADLGETESVSEDELPPDSEKKRKSGIKSVNKTMEKKAKTEGGNKRKLNAEGEYDPSSPTSENNDETPAKKVALSNEAELGDNKQDIKPASPKKKTLPELEKYWKAVNEDPSDFTGWTYLLQYVDQENDAEAAREAYTKFLERYPYCYGYWRKFADYEKKKGNPENVQMVFDQGSKAISLSVDLWLHYINHCKTVYEKDEEKLREQYERAIQACGLEFRSDRLWESYIKWELEGKRLSRVTALYDRLLCTPTLGYISHFEAFQEFVSSNLPNRILSVDDFLTIRAEVKALLKADDTTSASAADDAPPGEEPPPHEMPPTDEETRAIREKIISSRRKMHKANVNAVAARWSYEEGFVRYLESLKGDNVDKIRDVYSRACMVHHPKKPNLHLQWATFEEGQGNFEKAAVILENIDNVLPNMLQIAYRRINLERRRNDLEQACTLYENYISNSKNRTIANNIAVKYARFLCKVKNDVDKAIKVLLKATEKDKDNPRLYLQLIDLGLQRNPVDTQEIVGYMDMFIEREHADLEQRVLFAQRKVEFLEDFSPDIRQVLKAHEQFQKCIKQAKERKKTKSDDNKNDSSPPKKVKTGEQSNIPPPPSVGSQSYQYSSGPSGPYQSPQQFQGGQYGGQGGYQQGYQQYPPPSDPNYANYQNWQYGQGGPQAYGPYNQWGSYNYY